MMEAGAGIGELRPEALRERKLWCSQTCSWLSLDLDMGRTQLDGTRQSSSRPGLRSRRMYRKVLR
jgi:hypothetical protein